MKTDLLPDGGEDNQKPRDVFESDDELICMRAKACRDENQIFVASGKNWSLLAFGVVGGYK